MTSTSVATHLREGPVLFSAPMIIALLAGTKTQTRRIIKELPADAKNVRLIGPLLKWDAPAGSGRVSDRLDNRFFCARLWVRETFSTDALGVYPCPRAWYRSDFTKYDDPRKSDQGRDCEHGKKPRADCFACARDIGGFKWKPSIFMPRWASRITLDVGSTRVERLGDCSESDALAEGIEARGVTYGWPGSTTDFVTARAAYFAGWDMINGKGAAAKNPWVWVVTFKRVMP